MTNPQQNALAEALEPFAREADYASDDWKDSDSISEMSYCSLTFGDLRRARQALASNNPAAVEGQGEERVARILCEQHDGDPDAFATEEHDCWEGPLWTVFVKDARAIMSALGLEPGQSDKRVIGRLVQAARAIGMQAGVGERETAGAIVSYLATSPDEIEPFVAGHLSPVDFKGDWIRGGCLSWHAANGKIVHPPELPIAPNADREGV